MHTRPSDVQNIMKYLVDRGYFLAPFANEWNEIMKGEEAESEFDYGYQEVYAVLPFIPSGLPLSWREYGNPTLVVFELVSFCFFIDRHTKRKHDGMKAFKKYMRLDMLDDEDAKGYIGKPYGY